MKLQPTAAEYRQQLALAADRIIAQGYHIENMKEALCFWHMRRWWHRFAWWMK